MKRLIALSICGCACLGILRALPATAASQVFTNIYAFSTSAGGTNADGASPQAGLLLAGDTLYGTTFYGGAAAKGVVYRVNTNGGPVTVLHSFSAGNTNALGIFTNSDGANLVAEVIIAGNTLYGTAQYGGTSGRGTVFRVNTDGTGFTNLHNFSAILAPYYTNVDGAYPRARLALSGTTLYGTTQSGGTSARGTVFRVNTDGSGFANVCSLTGFKDGQTPWGGLVLAGDTLYGTSTTGGNYVSGAIFKVNTNGTGLTNVYTFSATGDSVYTNFDGAQPSCTLLLAGQTLYGTASIGGDSQRGTIYAVNTNGTGFRRLHSFHDDDGANPLAGLILIGDTLYGAAYSGGSFSYGALFSIKTNGNDYAVLHNMSPVEGAYLSGGVVQAGLNLYGTASGGGAHGAGALYRLFIQPRLEIARAGGNVILTWPTNYPGFALQSSTNLSAATLWSSVSPAPVVVNGEQTVTNSGSGARKFYRLAQ